MLIKTIREFDNYVFKTKKELLNFLNKELSRGNDYMDLLEISVAAEKTTITWIKSEER